MKEPRIHVKDRPINVPFSWHGKWYMYIKEEMTAPCKCALKEQCGERRWGARPFAACIPSLRKDGLLTKLVKTNMKGENIGKEEKNNNC